MLLCNTLIQYYLTITYFLQVPPSAHHIIYLGTFSSTFIRHSVFIFLLKISIDNRQIHPFPKDNNHSSLFLVPTPYLPIVSSSPMFPSPTCLLRSAPRTILSSLDILSIKSSRSSQKSFFSFMLLLTCGAYVLTTFRKDPFTSSFMAISLSDTLFTSRTLLASSSLTTIPIPFRVIVKQLPRHIFWRCQDVAV